MINILMLALGAALLLAGRRLFWLLVGGLGFVIGVTLATRFFNGNELTLILAGLILGVIFAVLAIFLESVAIGLAGFLGGGYAFMSIAGMLGLDRGGISTWVIFAVGGVLGVLLVGLLFKWALITISSLVGASMIVGSVGLTATTAGLLYLGLVIAGVLVQGTVMRREGTARGTA